MKTFNCSCPWGGPGVWRVRKLYAAVYNTFVLLEFLPCARKFQMFINKSNPFDIFPQTRAQKKCFMLWQPFYDCGRKDLKNHTEVKSLARATSPDFSDARVWASITVLSDSLWKAHASTQGQ